MALCSGSPLMMIPPPRLLREKDPIWAMSETSKNETRLINIICFPQCKTATTAPYGCAACCCCCRRHRLCLLLSIHALYFKSIVSIYKRNIIFSVSAAAVMPAPPHCQR